MPTYQYECAKCGAHFEVKRAIGARSASACPKCASRNVQQVLGAFYAKTIKKS